MKRIIALFLVVGMVSAALPVVGFSEETIDCAESTLKGKSDASTLHKAGGWFAGGLGGFTVGCVGGIAGGFIGTGLVVLIAAGSDPKPAAVPDEGTINENCYLNGYTKKARSKNVLMISSLKKRIYVGKIAFINVKGRDYAVHKNHSDDYCASSCRPGGSADSTKRSSWWSSSREYRGGGRENHYVVRRVYRRNTGLHYE